MSVSMTMRKLRRAATPRVLLCVVVVLAVLAVLRSRPGVSDHVLQLKKPSGPDRIDQPAELNKPGEPKKPVGEPKTVPESELRKRLDYSHYVHSDQALFEAYLKKFKKAPERMSMATKCDAFYKHWTATHPDWRYDNHMTAPYHMSVFQDPANPELEQWVATNAKVEQNMADTMGVFRVYAKCLLEEKVASFRQLTRRFFPFFNGHFPEIESEEGKFSDRYPAAKQSYNPQSDDIFEYIRTHQSGRGIVVSVTSAHRHDVVRLLRTLRALNNELPIEVVYKGDINQRTADAIQMTATADIDTLFGADGLVATHNRDFRGDLDLLKEYKKHGSRFPKQKVTFVNLAGMVDPHYKLSFGGYANKVLALLFSSFSEAILLDADVVPFEPLADLFDTPEYKETGTYFFKDRSLVDANRWEDTNLFAKLMPQGGLDALFGYHQPAKTLANRCMNGRSHHQEAGVVVIDKKKHFVGMLAMVPLLGWDLPMKLLVWGDKELYWMGLAVAGDDNYAFNEYSAASVGRFTQNPSHQYYQGVREVCSSHPGHVDRLGKLLWVNSGIQWCKKNSYYPDLDYFPHNLLDPQAVEKKYAQAVSIRAALVPPEYAPQQQVVRNEATKPDFDELSLIQDFKPLAQVPGKGWIKNRLCSGYTYCAYDRVDPGHLKGAELVAPAAVFEYSDAQGERLDYLAKVWFTGTESFSKKKAYEASEEQPPQVMQQAEPPKKPHALVDKIVVQPQRPNPGHVKGWEDEKVDELKLYNWRVHAE